jgi:hypothetical protein
LRYAPMILGEVYAPRRMKRGKIEAERMSD